MKARSEGARLETADVKPWLSMNGNCESFLNLPVHPELSRRANGLLLPSAKQSLPRVGRPLMITLVGFEKCFNKFIGAEFAVELEHG
jgi:hypothetical protein